MFEDGKPPCRPELFRQTPHPTRNNGNNQLLENDFAQVICYSSRFKANKLKELEEVKIVVDMEVTVFVHIS